jgi:hypothetical protein
VDERLERELGALSVLGRRPPTANIVEVGRRGGDWWGKALS